MIKKTLVGLTAVVLAIGVAGCGDKKKETKKTTTETTKTTEGGH